MDELNENLQLKLKTLRLINVYDLFGFTSELLEKSRYSVFGEIVTDRVTDTVDMGRHIAVEYLPGQFDQRAASAIDCVHLIDPSAKINIKSSKLIIVDDDASEETLDKIRRYVINPVESREKDLSKLSDTEHAAVKEVPLLEGFRNMTDADLVLYRKKMGLAMKNAKPPLDTGSQPSLAGPGSRTSLSVKFQGIEDSENCTWSGERVNSGR